jgi:hypothetical protein
MVSKFLTDLSSRLAVTDGPPDWFGPFRHVF